MATKKRQAEASNGVTVDEMTKPRIAKHARVVTSRLYGKSLNLWLWKRGERGPDDSFDKLMDLLKDHSSDVEEIDIGAELWNQFKSEEIELMFDAIKSLPNLRWLQLSLCESWKDARNKSFAIPVLSKIVSTASKLQHLLLKDLELSGTVSEWRVLTDAIKSHPSLRHLRMENYSFQDSQASLGDLMKNGFGGLTTLEIYSCEQNQEVGSLTDEDDVVKKSSSTSTDLNKLEVDALKSLFLGSPSLQFLRLCGLSITDEHIAEAVDALASHKSLQELVLWETCMTDKGAKDLSIALANLPSLRKVNLNDNAWLGAEGCKAVFESLTTTKGTQIQELYIGCHKMDGTCRLALLDMISKNRSIRKLDISFSWPHSETVKTLIKFESKLLTAIQSVSPRELEYVRLYNDAVSEKKSNNDAETDELCWSTLWENNQPKVPEVAKEQSDHQKE